LLVSLLSPIYSPFWERTFFFILTLHPSNNPPHPPREVISSQTVGVFFFLASLVQSWFFPRTSPGAPPKTRFSPQTVSTPPLSPPSTTVFLANSPACFYAAPRPNPPLWRQPLSGPPFNSKFSLHRPCLPSPQPQGFFTKPLSFPNTPPSPPLFCFFVSPALLCTHFLLQGPFRYRFFFFPGPRKISSCCGHFTPYLASGNPSLLPLFSRGQPLFSLALVSLFSPLCDPPALSLFSFSY